MSMLEDIREAVAVMRSKAEKATPGRYGFTSRWTTATTMLTRITRKGEVVAESRGDGHTLYDLNHLSCWSPDVALLVADVLEQTANGLERRGVTAHPKPHEFAAHDLARAYLGRKS